MFKRFGIVCVLGVMVGVALPVAIVTAQETEEGDNYKEPVGYSDLLKRIEQLENELTGPRSDLVSYESVGDGTASYGDPCCGTPCCGSANCNTCCNDYGCYAGVDFVFAKPYFEDGVKNGDPSYDYSYTPRFIIGHKGCNGVGVRARYWWFNDTSSKANGCGEVWPGFQTKLQLDVFDLELTRDFCCGPVRGTIFGGVRYAELDQRLISKGCNRMGVDGWGPVVGLDTSLPISCSCSMIANLRYAALFGDSYAGWQGRGDKCFNVMEILVGLQWDRQVGCGTLRLKGGIETQLWMNGMEDPAALTGGSIVDDDLTMLGLMFGVEYMR